MNSAPYIQILLKPEGFLEEVHSVKKVPGIGQ